MAKFKPGDRIRPIDVLNMGEWPCMILSVDSYGSYGSYQTKYNSGKDVVHTISYIDRYYELDEISIVEQLMKKYGVEV